MQRTRKSTAIIFSSLIFAAGFLASGETFRVHELHELALSDTNSECRVRAGINDALSVELPDDVTYINGIELTVRIPEIIASWRDTVAYSLYNGIKPTPAKDKIDYTGERISVGTFPGKLSYTIYIPISKDFSIKESPYHTILTAIPDTTGKFIFFRMQLAMKGVPEAFESETFDITARPVLRDKGALSLSVTPPEKDAGKNYPYSLYIDGELMEFQQANLLLLPTGEHHLSITSEYFRDEVRTFRIEQARETSLAVMLRDIAPTLRIISPENAKLFLDGEPFTAGSADVVVTPGDHTVRFVIGDYEVVKTVTAVNGRSYTVNLSVDATVSESE
ncbi:MAG: hypothetical protein K6G80_05990 [Treponema sp.]|nr:hypothetical protein [Treponema sp.]